MNRDKIISLCLSLGIHALLILLLLFFGFSYKAPEEESGVLLMVGEVELSAGEEHSASSAEDSVEPSSIEEPISEPEPIVEDVTPLPNNPAPVKNNPVMTQDLDDAPSIAAAREKKQKEEEAKKKADEAAKAKAEEDAKARAEEAKRKAEEEEARRKAEEEAKKRAAAQNFVAGAFGKNSGTGTQANGVQGTTNGNSATGANRGSAGYGEYDLGGRGISGTLPKPDFNVNASGKVVVKITVNAEGIVIATEIAPGTNTANQTLRNSALAAAHKARFKIAEGAGNVTGTITYFFDSNN